MYNKGNQGGSMSNVRDEMSDDVVKLFLANPIFHKCVNRGIGLNLSYKEILEKSVLVFASIQEDYNNAELEKVMNESGVLEC